MSDVFYNHVSWTDLNVLQEIGQGAFALVYEVSNMSDKKRFIFFEKIKKDVNEKRYE